FLGVPVGANPRLRSTWQLIIDSIKARLNSWKSRQLSIGGRITLINSVLASLPLFLFSFYKAPKKVIEKIIKLQRRFLWGGDGENKKMAWVSWDTICISKEKGGLGIKNLEAFNLALLIKWRWKILVE
ncbi:Putative ribonuclease H protein, partial [Glycine soja]